MSEHAKKRDVDRFVAIRNDTALLIFRHCNIAPSLLSRAELKQSVDHLHIFSDALSKMPLKDAHCGSKMMENLLNGLQDKRLHFPVSVFTSDLWLSS